jgi:AcrR family transcriptional regulator
MSRFGDLNAAFHSAFVAVARSPMLAWCLQRLESAAFASPAAVVIPAEGDGARRAFEEHEAILNAIQSGDASRAEALVRQHAGLAIHGIQSALEGRPHSSRNIALELVGKKPADFTANRPSRLAKKEESAAGATSVRILDAAADLFCERGFYAATTRELATRLNIQPASLYHHVSNKEELLHRICRQVMDCFLTNLPIALNQAETASDRISAQRVATIELAHNGGISAAKRAAPAHAPPSRAARRASSGGTPRATSSSASCARCASSSAWISSRKRSRPQGSQRHARFSAPGSRTR